MFDELQARVAAAARRVGLKAALGGLAAVSAVTGVGFVADAAWRYLALTYDTIVASTILGLVFLSLALVLVVLAGAVGARRPRPRVAPPPEEPDPDQEVRDDAELIALVLKAFRSGRATGSRMRGR